MNGTTTLRRGAWLALATSLISGVSVFVAKYGTQAVPDPFVYTTARNAVVGSLLVLLLLARGGRDLRSVGRADAGRLALIALVGGSVPFLLFFWGLTLTSAPMASFIQKTQFLWVALLAAPLLGEALGRWQALGLAALGLGTLLQGPVAFGRVGPGEGLVLAATLLWSAEALLVRRTLRDVAPLAGATARMAGGAAVMLVFLLAAGRLPLLLGLGAEQWLWVAGPALLLLGYVLTWYAALARAPAAVVTSVLTLGAPLTALLNAVLVTGALPTQTLPGAVLLALGAGLVVLSVRRGGAAAGRTAAAGAVG
jgi:drug/metabolite transporter (DMT)-like permease